MANEVHPWSIRSALISVADLDRSVSFYQDVMNLDEILRADGMVVLGFAETNAFTLYIRHTNKPAHPGQQAVGVRSLVCDVGSIAELDRVEARLKTYESLRARQTFHESEKFELVHGHDPDRLPLTFFANEEDSNMSVADYCRVMVDMYSVDV
jgi:catechol-2,3-dioxygenase